MCEIYKDSLRPVSSDEMLFRDEDGEIKVYNKGEIYGWVARRSPDGVKIGLSEYDPRVQEYIKKHIDSEDIVERK